MLEFDGHICFGGFTTEISPTDKIAVIGDNGTGKTTLIKIIGGLFENFSGCVKNTEGLNFGYVPQVVEGHESLSGAEKFNKLLSSALALRPDVLLLDEPTNHLDEKNRKSLIRMINNFRGPAVIASHDINFLRDYGLDKIWHIDGGLIKIFCGKYDDYISARQDRLDSIDEDLRQARREKKEIHKSLMREQVRAKHSKQRGERLVEQRRWIPAVAHGKASQASKTAGKNNFGINTSKDAIVKEMASLRQPKTLKPKFMFCGQKINADNTILSISGGNCFYGGKQILDGINLSLKGAGRLAIIGKNASGKTTLLKAILSNPDVIRTGDWLLPDKKDIGLLDQHYSNLDQNATVLSTIEQIFSGGAHADIRDFLNDFLFRTNEEVNKQIKFLSGGQKARLALAVLAARPFKLMLFDEITNNVDMLTKGHICDVLNSYPAGFIIVSHDGDFLDQIENLDRYYIR
jgi:ATPase subunit of ABC transporter with duplicated ATPase domains